MNPAALLDIISRGGIVGVGIVLVWALLTDRLVPRRRLDEEKLWRHDFMVRFDMLLDLLRKEVGHGHDE
jgi:hypothetical protein